MKKQRKINWYKLMIHIIIVFSVVFGGFALGMIYQQMLFAKEIGMVLSYTNIHVNFNETKLTEELTNKFIPAFRMVFNETIIIPASQDKIIK